MRLIHRPEHRCHCGNEVWEVEKIEGRQMVSRICRGCNPFWIKQGDMAYRRARKQADELQAKENAA